MYPHSSFYLSVLKKMQRWRQPKNVWQYKITAPARLVVKQFPANERQSFASTAVFQLKVQWFSRPVQWAVTLNLAESYSSSGDWKNTLKNLKVSLTNLKCRYGIGIGALLFNFSKYLLFFPFCSWAQFYYIFFRWRNQWWVVCHSLRKQYPNANWQRGQETHL